MPPNAFDWLIADRLGACVNPSVSTSAAAELKSRGVGMLVNLHERADPPELLRDWGVETIHLPVADFHVPTQDQLRRGVAAIQDALGRGVRVAVHCAGGLGRSGTLLAAYLVSQGTSADDAIAQVRAARPGSVETLEQEDAVRQFAQTHRC